MAELLHRLAKGEKGTPELSLRDDPAQETLRFSADASLAFPCSDISALKRDTSGAFRMTTTFMGLQGSQSPLPGYYLDHLAWKAVHEQSPVGDFLDMFSHRLTQFVWHIWRKYRYHISFRNGGVDAFSQRMYSLVGLGHRQLRDKLAINHSKMLAYSGILANPGRSPEIICGLVSHCFDLSEVTLQNWQRRKVDIEPDQQNSLGSYSLKNGEKLAGRSVLGNFVLGTRVPDLSGKFQLSITSLTRKQFLSFLPSGENFLPLTMFVSFILRDQLAWDLHLGLAPEQVGAMRLGDEGSLSLPPFTGYDEKSQRDYHLALRGNSLNPMIDAATPLLGMVMRLSTMNSQTMPEHLFAQVVTDVQAVEQLLQEQGYEPGVIISFRYILCTFIDEAALGNGWSNKNEWIKQSLLVHFHNEAWGGEKVFILLERLIREPKRYQDLLEFLWLCFSLGFRGRYKVAAQDQGEFEQIYRRLYHVLHKLRGDAPFPLLHQDKKTQGGRYQLISRLTIKHIFCGGVVVLALFYLFYLLRLDSQTQDILHQLNKLLR
nr:type VI secretion system baseplate subunit TssG [Escherichia coli]